MKNVLPKARVYISSLNPECLSVLNEGGQWVGLPALIKRDTAVVVKPNLTFPTFRKGVMTNPQILEAVIVYLKQFTDQITICESDSGGYNRFSMDEVFAKTGISEFAKRYGVRVINMSHSPSRPIRIRIGWRTLEVPLPRFLLDETDLFITMPVPKVHSNAIVSLGLKNQWGMIQQPELRLKLHPHFKEVIYGINKALPKTFVIVDGKYGLTRNGPLRGDVVDLNWILISDEIFTADLVVSEIMGFDWRHIPYLRYASKREGIYSIEDSEFNADFHAFKTTKFYLQREWTDYPGVMTFNSRLLAYIGYESSLAKSLHWLLYRFREPFY
jgi:uncharacterized protein (DUF362 family)